MFAQIALPNVPALIGGLSNAWPVPAVVERSAASPRGWPNDAAWIADIRAGDEAAATALVERLSPLVLKCVRSHRPRRTSEDDMVQAVFMKIFSKLDQFSGQVPLEHWVSRITINTCIKQLDYESVRPELRMSDLREEEEAVVQQLAASPEELPGDYALGARELVAKLLTLLRPDDRTVITLLHLESRSTEEVSRLTGWSVPVVKVRAFRARNKMRRALKSLLARDSVPMESLGWCPA